MVIEVKTRLQELHVRKRKQLNWLSGRNLDENREFSLAELVIVLVIGPNKGKLLLTEE